MKAAIRSIFQPHCIGGSDTAPDVLSGAATTNKNVCQTLSDYYPAKAITDADVGSSIVTEVTFEDRKYARGELVLIRGISPNAEMRTKLFVVSHLIPHRKYDAIIILHRINDKNTGTIEMEGIYPKEYVLVFIKNLPGIKTYLLSIERKDGRKILQGGDIIAIAKPGISTGSEKK